jgi:hypothetical protein
LVGRALAKIKLATSFTAFIGQERSRIQEKQRFLSKSSLPQTNDAEREAESDKDRHAVHRKSQVINRKSPIRNHQSETTVRRLHGRDARGTHGQDARATSIENNCPFAVTAGLIALFETQNHAPSDSDLTSSVTDEASSVIYETSSVTNQA